LPGESYPQPAFRFSIKSNIRPTAPCVGPSRGPRRARLVRAAVNDGATLDATRERLRAAGAPVTARPAGFETADPCGTRIRFVPA
jgi:hypothetical protein